MVKKVASVVKADVRNCHWWLKAQEVNGLPQLRTSDEESWYSQKISPTMSLREKHTMFIADTTTFGIILSAVESAFEHEVSLYQNAKGSKLSGDQKWVTDVLKSEPYLIK